MAHPAILVNITRCTGCWTCSIACKTKNHLATDEWWQYVRTIGSGTGVDEPGGVYPNVTMDWMPIYTTDCTLCGDRIKDGLKPSCVTNCPVEALTYGDRDDPDSAFNKRMDDLKQKGYRVFQQKPWERTKQQVYYAKKLS